MLDYDWEDLKGRSEIMFVYPRLEIIEQLLLRRTLALRNHESSALIP
jgi:hypothetical protein